MTIKTWFKQIRRLNKETMIVPSVHKCSITAHTTTDSSLSLKKYMRFLIALLLFNLQYPTIFFKQIYLYLRFSQILQFLDQLRHERFVSSSQGTHSHDVYICVDGLLCSLAWGLCGSSNKRHVQNTQVLVFQKKNMLSELTRFNPKMMRCTRPKYNLFERVCNLIQSCKIEILPTELSCF